MKACNQCGINKNSDEYHPKETTCKKCRHERRSELRRMKRLENNGAKKSEEPYADYKNKMDQMELDMLKLEKTVRGIKSKEKRKKERVSKIANDMDIVTQKMERICVDDARGDAIESRDQLARLCKYNVQLRHDVHKIETRSYQMKMPRYVTTLKLCEMKSQISDS
jgi:hypothetical protein